MKIGQFDTDERTLVVAEIGNNHEGDFGLAAEMIGLAAHAGADAVKFQTFRTEHYVSWTDEARFNRLKGFELSFDQFEKLNGIARDAGVMFFSTPLDLVSAGFLSSFVPCFKIASCDNTFYPLLDIVAQYGKPVILSTGLAGLGTVRLAVERIEKGWPRGSAVDSVALLHCVSQYPVPPGDVNLRAIGTLKGEFGCTVGYSDHTLGVDVSVLAVAAGARIVEKHFTVDKHYSDFRDHQLSADPAEMKHLVERIREAELVLGSGEKKPSASEADVEHLLRRSVAAARDLEKGAVIGMADITWVRPGGKVAPGDEAVVLGKRLLRAIRQGEHLAPDDLEDGS